MSEIIQNTADITHNTSKRSGKIKYIVIHYTATDGATAKNEITYFSRKTTTRASADYFVDFDGTVYQYNTDLNGRYCWAVGGGRQSAQGGSMYRKITNANSVSIEMCCRKSGNNWIITDQTYLATIELAKLLKYLLGLPAGSVYRHYDVNGKMCPNVVGFIGNESRWLEMKAAIDASTADTTTTTNAFKWEVTVTKLRIRTGAGTNYPWTGKYTGKGTFTIVETKNGFGRLKSGAGWISLDTAYGKKV